MKMILTKDNIVEYAWSNYSNVQMFHREEFLDDLRILYYIKKLLTRGAKGEETTHLILNHCITLNNLFGPEATVNLLHFYVDGKHRPAIDAVLFFLKLLPPSAGAPLIDGEILAILQSL